MRNHKRNVNIALSESGDRWHAEFYDDLQLYAVYTFVMERSIKVTIEDWVKNGDLPWTAAIIMEYVKPV